MPQKDRTSTRTKKNRARATHQYVDVALHSGNVISDQTVRIGADQVEQQLGNILERISDPVLALDQDWHYTYVNQRAASLFGSRPEELIGKRIWMEFPEGRGQPFHTACERARAEQVSVQIESYYERWNRWFENRIYPSPSGLSIFFHEITERKRALLLTGQNQVLELIARSAPLEESLDLLLRVIEEQSPGMVCSILLLDSAGLHLRHCAAPSLPERFTQSIDGKPIGPRAGSCGTAAFRGEPVIVENIATDPLWQDYRDLALKHGLLSCWSTPIFDEQPRVLGTFALYFCNPARPTVWHRELIDMATSTAAIAIVRHQRMETLRASEERLRLAAMGGNVGIWEWDIRTDCLVWSDELKAIFGWPTRPKII